MLNLIGKNLIIIGLIIAVIGVILYFKESISLLKFFGKLPGDIMIKKENFSLYFPIGTSIILSIIFSLILILINKIR